MSEDWPMYRDDDLGFALRHPADWHTQPYRRMLRPHFSGVFVSNVPRPFRPDDARTGTGNRWPPAMAGLPPTAIVIAFDYMVGGPVAFGGGLEPDSSLPLSVEAANRTVEDGFVCLSVRPIRMNGSPRYALWVWIGSDGSAADRKLAERVVASIMSLRGPTRSSQSEPRLRSPLG